MCCEHGVRSNYRGQKVNKRTLAESDDQSKSQILKMAQAFVVDIANFGSPDAIIDS